MHLNYLKRPNLLHAGNLFATARVKRTSNSNPNKLCEAIKSGSSCCIFTKNILSIDLSFRKVCTVPEPAAYSSNTF